MKNVLIGCGIVFLIVLIVVGYGGYRIYRFAQDVGLHMKSINERYEALNIQIPFSEPVDGLISSQRFDLWIQLRVDLSEQINEMVDSIGNFSIQTIFQVRDETFETAELFAESLETALMSPLEYLWITQQVVGVLNSGDARTNPQMEEMIKAFQDLSQEDRNNRNSFDPSLLEKPVIHSQIIRTCDLLIGKKESFLSSINVFYADLALMAILETDNPDPQDESETVELFSSTQIPAY